MGFFDSGQDGLAESHPVGLWNSSGVLLAETTVTTSDPLVNQWRYNAITPVGLAANQVYFVGALYLDGNDPNVFSGDAGNVTTTANINYLNATYVGGGTLTDPTTVFGSPGYFGPNISASAVPEASTWAMMMLGFVGLAFASYRASRKSVAFAA